MGLNQGDLEKVPKGMSVIECYERIYNWHKKHGEKRLKRKPVKIIIAQDI